MQLDANVPLPDTRTYSTLAVDDPFVLTPPPGLVR